MSLFLKLVSKYYSKHALNDTDCYKIFLSLGATGFETTISVLAYKEYKSIAFRVCIRTL